MGRVTTLAPRVRSAPSRTPAAKPLVPTYGQGRGGRPWRRKRDAVMKRDRYLCVPCGKKGRTTEGTEVDHVVNVAEGGTDDVSNLQTICTECHLLKSQEEARRGTCRAG